jgi:hypothetical protein
VPTVPEFGLTLLIVGAAATTVKLTPLLACPPTVTTTATLPVVAGTVAPMLVLLQLVTVAVVPPNVTVLLPWVAPKFVPVMVIVVPTAPEGGTTPAIMIMGTGGAWLLVVTEFAQPCSATQSKPTKATSIND